MSDEVVTSSMAHESITAPTTESAPEPVVEASSTNESTDGGETTETETPATPAYVPNYKLKVYDQETELNDPFLKDLIKDADSEKKVKEIAQKYLGFDTVKEKNQKVTEEYKNYQASSQPILQVYNQYSKLASAGDLDGIFQLLKIPEQEIFKYAVQKAEEAQMSPDQRMYLQQQRQTFRNNQSLEEQNQSLQTQHEQQRSELRTMELNFVMARPDVHSTAQAYDTRMGQPGAFRQLVREKGLAHHMSTKGKEDLSADQAVMEVMKYIGVLVTPQQAQASAQQGMAPNVALIPQHNAPPIIPNVTGRGTSPVRKQVRSIADLKKRRDELGSSSQE